MFNGKFLGFDLVDDFEIETILDGDKFVMELGGDLSFCPVNDSWEGSNFDWNFDEFFEKEGRKIKVMQHPSQFWFGGISEGKGSNEMSSGCVGVDDVWFVGLDELVEFVDCFEKFDEVKRGKLGEGSLEEGEIQI